ncbi:hypothetical protein [Brevundimonas sp.]|uniref:lysozyme inhibitor LprI family protein n=1 Tax=Brevundimonas sp. TaxID=1871086 RepID=UPI0028A14974|nr:hypothetical protein [Brevundimonas sp.]
MRCVLGSVLVAAGLLSSAILFAPNRADAASFDCARARSASERAICGNRSLEDRDVKMATLYSVVRQFQGGMGALAAMRDRQSEWLGQRELCGANIACIRRSYDVRIAELERGVTAAAGR